MTLEILSENKILFKNVCFLFTKKRLLLLCNEISFYESTAFHCFCYLNYCFDVPDLFCFDLQLHVDPLCHSSELNSFRV